VVALLDSGLGAPRQHRGVCPGGEDRVAAGRGDGRLSRRARRRASADEVGKLDGDEEERNPHPGILRHGEAALHVLARTRRIADRDAQGRRPTAARREPSPLGGIRQADRQLGELGRRCRRAPPLGVVRGRVAGDGGRLVDPLGRESKVAGGSLGIGREGGEATVDLPTPIGGRPADSGRADERMAEPHDVVVQHQEAGPKRLVQRGVVVGRRRADEARGRYAREGDGQDGIVGGARQLRQAPGDERLGGGGDRQGLAGSRLPPGGVDRPDELEREKGLPGLPRRPWRSWPAPAIGRSGAR